MKTLLQTLLVRMQVTLIASSWELYIKSEVRYSWVGDVVGTDHHNECVKGK